MVNKEHNFSMQQCMQRGTDIFKSKVYSGASPSSVNILISLGPTLNNWEVKKTFIEMYIFLLNNPMWDLENSKFLWKKLFIKFERLRSNKPYLNYISTSTQSMHKNYWFFSMSMPFETWLNIKNLIILF